MSELPIKRSEQIGELFAALAKAQLNYKTVTRTHENTFTSSKYADLQDLIDATQPSLAAEGLTIIQLPIEDLAQKRAGAFSILGHSSGQFISTEFYLPAVGKASGGAEKLDAQTIGAAVTYSKRYTYSGLTGVVGEAEDDGNAVADRSADKAAPVPPTKTVKAPPVSQAKASTGGERPNKAPEPPASVQPAAQTNDPVSPAVSPVPKAVIPADTQPVQLPLTPAESTSSQSEPPDKQADKQADISEKPSKSQLDAYIARVRDEIKPALEKAGLKPSKGIQTGAKLKNFILGTYGNPKAKELTDLTIHQWEAFFGFVETTNDFVAVVAKIEGGK